MKAFFIHFPDKLWSGNLACIVSDVTEMCHHPWDDY